VIAGSNPVEVMDVCLLSLYFVVSCVGRGICDGLITRPEESYCVYNCVRSRNLKRGGQGTAWDVEAYEGGTMSGVDFVVQTELLTIM
jgi:hypothetical protein